MNLEHLLIRRDAWEEVYKHYDYPHWIHSEIHDDIDCEIDRILYS